MYHRNEMARNKHISIGQLGEDIVTQYLKNRGYRIVERNYRKKWGEIDVIAQKDTVLHFIEVKSTEVFGEVPREGEEAYRPEDHVHAHKKERLSRVIQTYLLEKKVSAEKEWAIDVAVVHINTETKKAHVRILYGVIFE